MTERTEPILRVRDLETRFYADFGVVRAVDGVSFDVHPGETLGLVGESGSGKSVTALSVLQLIPSPGRIVKGTVELEGVDLAGLTSEELRRIRGKDMATVFQNPMTALNPALQIGWQLDEAYVAHHGRKAKTKARDKAIEMLRSVGIAEAEKRAESYPHQYSGGMRQRIVIAMGMMNEPKLMIADEPTTALDVTIQAQVIVLLQKLIEEHNMALILITHNMGVVANMCDRVAVMYAGEIVEEAAVDEIFDDPRHPYTWALLRSLPNIQEIGQRLPAIPGFPPDPTSQPTGCRFRARCPFAEDICERHPDLIEVSPGQKSRCWLAHRHETFADRDETLLRGGELG